MAFNVENASGSALDIDDLGITIPTGGVIDLSVQGSYDTIVGTLQVGEEVYNLITAGSLIVKDPNDGVSNLIIADGLACAGALGDPNYRVGVGARAQDVAFTPNGDNAATDLQAAVDENSGKVEWRGAWIATSYNKDDLVRDGDWTMIANTDTTDRAAPTPDGDPEFLLPSIPVWVQDGNLSTVELVHTYTFAESGWLPQIRIWPAAVTVNYEYRLRVSDITDPLNPTDYVLQLNEESLVAGAWNSFSTQNFIIVAGTILEFELYVVDSASSSTFTGGWTYDSQSGGNSTPSVPALAGFTTNGQYNILRMDKTDLDTTDRTSELLSVTPGSTIDLVETGDASNNVSLLVLTNPLDLGSYVQYFTSLTNTGSGGTPTVGETTTVNFEVPVPSNTDYVELASTWDQPQPDFITSVTSKLSYDGVDQGAANTTAYGIDLLFQRANVSTDWDLVATSQIVNSSGGGSTAADELVKVSSNDTVAGYLDGKLIAGGNISLVENNDGANETLTIDSPLQNLWETITSDAGSTVANIATDTLTVSGGTGISTAIAGDVLTITGTTDELVKISANDTTAGFLGVKIVGVSDETAITELNDAGDEDLEIGLADNVILPGIESVTLPSGTLLERPGSPAAGMMRYNDTTNFMEYYNGTDWITVVGNSIGPGTLAGSIVGYHFLENKFSYGTWLGTTTAHITSDEVQYVMPFNAEIVAITYSSSTQSSDIELNIEIAADGAGSTNSTAYSWSVYDARVARISTLVIDGGPGGIVLTAGTKLAVFADQPTGVGQVEPGDMVVSVYIQWTDEVEEESIEDFGGDFT